MLTFFGGTIATADLGPIATCGILSLSPLMDRRRACIRVNLLAAGIACASRSRDDRERRHAAAMP